MTLYDIGPIWYYRIYLTLKSFLALSWSNLFHFPFILLKYFCCFALSFFRVFFDILCGTRSVSTKSESVSFVAIWVTGSNSVGWISKSGKVDPDAEFSKIDSDSMISIIVDCVGNVDVKSAVLIVWLRCVGLKMAYFFWYETVALISSNPIFSLISSGLFFCDSDGFFYVGVQVISKTKFIVNYDL